MIALLWLVACAATPSAEAPEAALDLPAGAAIAYRLARARDGAIPWGDGWIFHTDLGYAVALEEAWLLTLAAELVPCSDALAQTWIASARADHATDADASLIEAVIAEDLLSTEPVELGVGVAGGGPYCEAYALSGVAAEPGQPRLEGQTVHLRGWYLAPDATEITAFQAEVGLGAAALPTLRGQTTTEALTDASGAPVGAVVTLTRHPARALDGQDLAALSEAELAYAFLAGLSRTAEAEWSATQ